jgi:hypothetical protein
MASQGVVWATFEINKTKARENPMPTMIESHVLLLLFFALRLLSSV